MESNILRTWQKLGFWCDEETTIFTIMGSYEPRKGQDLAVDAIKRWPAETRRSCQFRFFGRTLEPDFLQAIRQRAGETPEITLGDDLSHAASRAAALATDVLLCP